MDLDRAGADLGQDKVGRLGEIGLALDRGDKHLLVVAARQVAELRHQDGDRLRLPAHAFV